MSVVHGYNTAIYELMLFTSDALNQVKEYMLGMHFERIQADWGSARAPYQVLLVEQCRKSSSDVIGVASSLTLFYFVSLGVGITVAPHRSE